LAALLGSFVLGSSAVLITTTALAAGAAPSAIAAPDAVPGQLLVTYGDGVSAAAQAAIEAGVGASIVRTIPELGVHVLRVPDAAADRVVDALSHNPAVTFAERDHIAQATSTPNDYWWPSEWSPVKTNAPTAWNTTTGSASVVVAVLDSGVDTTQPDLQSKLVAGRDIVNNDADPTDDNGHGTMTAGIVGAASNNGIGVASYCWGCAVMPVKVLGADGTGSYSNIAAGITWAADNGARVINLSLGGTTDSSTLHSAVTYAHDKGVVLVAAAGNSGTTAYNYPAAFPEVVSVAGTDSTDVLYSWSNYGSWVKVAAPGMNYTVGRSGWYGQFGGTSSASPVVAGIAGLVASAAPAATTAQIEQAITSSAVKVGSWRMAGWTHRARSVRYPGAALPHPPIRPRRLPPRRRPRPRSVAR